MNGEEIKTLRKVLNLTQVEFSQAIGVTTGSISRWESGRVKPSKLAKDKIKQLQQGSAK